MEAPRCPQEAPKSLPRRPQDAPRGSREAPRGSQEAPKRPSRPILRPSWRHLGAILRTRSPKRPQLHHENEHFLWEGCYFSAYPVACNMSPLGRRRGPALRAESGGGLREVRPRQPAVSDPARTYCLRLILRSKDGPTPFRRPPCGRLERGPFLASSWP